MSDLISQIAGFLTALGRVGPVIVTLALAGLVLSSHFRRALDDQRRH